MKKFLKFALGATLGLALAAAPVLAQYIPDVLAKGQDVAVAGTGVASYSPILIRYVGSNPAGGTVTVATTNLTLKSGTVGSSAADTTTECPVSGALGGVIDMSNGSCDTLGEIVDAINASSNWRAAIQDGVRSDSYVTSGALSALAEASAAVPQGLALKGDSSVTKQVTYALAIQRDDIRFYLNESGGTKGLNENPFEKTRGVLWRGTLTLAGTGADTFDFLSVRPVNRTTSLTASAVVSSAAETAGSTYSEPGGGTGVNKSFDFTRFGLGNRNGEKILVRGRFATTLTAVTLFSAGGRVYDVPRSN